MDNNEKKSLYDNAQIGDDTLIEPNVQAGFRYHPDCGGTIIGNHGILRSGTIIYGDVTAGDYFQTGHCAIIRAMVEIGDEPSQQPCPDTAKDRPLASGQSGCPEGGLAGSYGPGTTGSGGEAKLTGNRYD